MLRRKKGEIEWLEFESLQEHKELVHGVFLSPLDMSLETHEKQSTRSVALDALNVSHYANSHQVHGDAIQVADHENRHFTSCDGMITKENDLALLIKHADCQAAIFFDPIEQVVANVHCGWRGNVANIYSKTIAALKGKFGCKPENLFVCISPSLGPEHAEFIHHKLELPLSFSEYKIGECHFNFWEISKMQLQKEGVLPHHVEVAKICTFANRKDFFSYRRDKKTGRHGTFVALKKKNPV